MMPVSVAANIKFLREQRQLTQQDVARAAACSVQTVSSWENGRKTPRINTLETLAALFGVTKGQLLDGDAQTLTRLCLQEDERALLDLYRQIPTDHRPRVLATFAAALRGLAIIE
jgi:transcriptional regulator with XRE-family HTH domain